MGDSPTTVTETHVIKIQELPEDHVKKKKNTHTEKHMEVLINLENTRTQCVYKGLNGKSLWESGMIRRCLYDKIP